MLWGSNVPQTRTPGRAFLHRGPLQGHQERRRLPRLCRGDQVRRSVAASEAGHRRRAGVGDRPRHPARILPRPHRPVFRGLRPPLHRPADAGPPGAQGRRLRRPSACCARRISPTAWARRTTPPGRPWHSTRTASRWCRWARSASAGASRASGTSRRRRARAATSPLALTPRGRRHGAEVAFPYFGGAATNGFTATDHGDVLTRNRPGPQPGAEGRRHAGGHGVRPDVRQLRPGSRLRRRQRCRRLRARTSRSRRPGPRTSPACRATRSSMSRASSRPTRRRPTAARWSSSAPG